MDILILECIVGPYLVILGLGALLDLAIDKADAWLDRRNRYMPPRKVK